MPQKKGSAVVKASRRRLPVYRYAVSSRINLAHLEHKDLPKVLQHLHKLEQSRGRINTHELIDSAKAQSSPIHKYFDWDDKTAAEKFRRSQAVRLVSSIVMIPENSKDQVEIPVFMSVRTTPADEKVKAIAYVSTNTVTRDPARLHEVVQKGKCRLVRFRERYAFLEEFARVCEAIDELTVTV